MDIGVSVSLLESSWNNTKIALKGTTGEYAEWSCSFFFLFDAEIGLDRMKLLS